MTITGMADLYANGDLKKREAFLAGVKCLLNRLSKAAELLDFSIEPRDWPTYLYTNDALGDTFLEHPMIGKGFADHNHTYISQDAIQKVLDKKDFQMLKLLLRAGDHFVPVA